jgi:RNA polymerase sigma-70 factor (ECF subfamily)
MNHGWQSRPTDEEGMVETRVTACFRFHFSDLCPGNKNLPKFAEFRSHMRTRLQSVSWRSMNYEQSMSSETKAVINSVRNGDHTALESALVRHRDYLRRVISLRMDDLVQARVDPSDVVQDAQLEAMRRVNDYVRNPKLPLRLWMRQIAVDRLNMTLRRHLGTAKRDTNREVRLPEESSISIAEGLLAELPTPSQAFARKEVVQAVQDSIRRLKEKDREIIILRVFEGLSSEEASQVLGIDTTTARKRLGRALLRLREQLIASGLGEAGQ